MSCCAASSSCCESSRLSCCDGVLDDPTVAAKDDMTSAGVVGVDGCSRCVLPRHEGCSERCGRQLGISSYGALEPAVRRAPGYMQVDLIKLEFATRARAGERNDDGRLKDSCLSYPDFVRFRNAGKYMKTISCILSICAFFAVSIRRSTAYPVVQCQSLVPRRQETFGLSSLPLTNRLCLIGSTDEPSGALA